MTQATELLESRYRVPILGWRFGNDALIGLIPVVGDVVGMALGFSLLWEAIRLRMPIPDLLRMVARLAIDAAIGAIPLIGDLADFGYRANARNLAQLQHWTGEEARRAA